MNQKHDVRRSLVQRFIAYKEDVRAIATQLERFDWDYGGAPVILDKAALRHILTLYKTGQIHADDVAAWADFLEVRDDVAFPPEDAEMLEDILHALANPLLEGQLHQDGAAAFLERLA